MLKKYWLTFKTNVKVHDPSNSCIRSVFSLFDKDSDGLLNNSEAVEYVCYLLDISGEEKGPSFCFIMKKKITKLFFGKKKGIKLHLIDAIPYGMNFLQYYEQFVREVIAYMNVDAEKEGTIDLLELIKVGSDHKLFPLLRFLSEKGWQLHLTRQNYQQNQESSVQERPHLSGMKSEKDITDVDFGFKNSFSPDLYLIVCFLCEAEPDASFAEISVQDFTQSADSLSSGETSDMDVPGHLLEVVSFPQALTKVKVPSGECHSLESVNANTPISELKTFCSQWIPPERSLSDCTLFYGNEM